MRNASIDLLKVSCAIGIFLLHIDFLKNHIPIISFILSQGLFRMAVPIFAMISGYYFYSIQDSKKLKSWIIRIVILYLIWTVLYSPFWFSSALDTDVIDIFTGYFTLWYLASLIPAGILLYFIKKNKRLHTYGLAISLYLIGYIIQTLSHMTDYSGFIGWLLKFYPTYRNFLFDLLPIMIVGSKLQERESIEGVIKPGIWILLLAMASVALESAINYLWIDRNSAYDLLLTIPFSCAVLFLYCKNKISIQGNSVIFSKIATAIFLTQVAAFELSFLILGSAYKIPHVPLVLYAAVITGIFSTVIILLQKKLKYIL